MAIRIVSVQPTGLKFAARGNSSRPLTSKLRRGPTGDVGILLFEPSTIPQWGIPSSLKTMDTRVRFITICFNLQTQTTFYSSSIWVDSNCGCAEQRPHNFWRWSERRLQICATPLPLGTTKQERVWAHNQQSKDNHKGFSFKPIVNWFRHPTDSQWSSTWSTTVKTIQTFLPPCRRRTGRPLQWWQFCFTWERRRHLADFECLPSDLIFVQMGPRDNVAMQTIVEVVGDLVKPGTSPVDLTLSLTSLYPNNGNGDFVTYLGSLTTPNCAERVLWTVFLDSVPISKKQVRFRRSINSIFISKFLDCFLGWRDSEKCIMPKEFLPSISDQFNHSMQELYISTSQNHFLDSASDFNRSHWNWMNKIWKLVWSGTWHSRRHRSLWNFDSQYLVNDPVIRSSQNFYHILHV